MALRCVLLALVASQASAQTTFFVDCTRGNDDNAGTSASSAFATLTRARNAVRALPRPLTPPGVVVSVAAGVCSSAANFSSPLLTLDDASGDSGAPGAPVVWRGAGPATILSVGLALPTAPAAWAPIAGAPGCFVTPLAGVPHYDSAFGLGSLRAGGLGACASGKAAVFVGGEPTTPARFPNIDATTGEWMWEYAVAATLHTAGGGSVTLNSTRPLDKGWPAESTWLHGLWAEDWADSYVRLRSATRAACPGGHGSCTVLAADPATPPIYDFTTKCRFMGVDLAQELDAENETYVDVAAETVSFCPMGGSMAGIAPLFLSMGSTVISVVGADGASAQRSNWSAALYVEGRPSSDFYPSVGPSPSMVSDVVITGFTLSHSRVAGLSASSVASVVFDSLSIVGHGAGGIEVHDAWNSVVSNVDVRGVGCHAVNLAGGDTMSLTPANLTLTGSRISDFARVTRTYAPGVAWYGVGVHVTGTEVSNGPHSGILGGGNDCQFSENYLHDLCYEATDSGGWYAGRSWVNRGNVLSRNRFENIFVREKPALGAPSINAVYFDDELSQQTLVNNTFSNCWVGLLLGGGRDNIVQGNTFTDLRGPYAVTFDARGLGWQKDYCHYNATDPAASGELVTDLFARHYQVPPYSTRYPLLPGLLADRPCTPVGNFIGDNTFCRTKAFLDESDAQVAAWGSTSRNNIERCA